MDLFIIYADPDSGFSIPARLFNILHGINKTLPTKFPIDILQNKTGNVTLFRIFEDKNVLSGIKENLEKHHVVRDYATVGKIKRVPKNVTSYIEVRRKSIPSLKGRINTTQRPTCIAYCRTLLHFNIRSGSNGNKFPLYVDFIPHSSAIENMNPSNYGLSSKEREFTIPRF